MAVTASRHGALGHAPTEPSCGFRAPETALTLTPTPSRQPGPHSCPRQAAIPSHSPGTRSSPGDKVLTRVSVAALTGSWPRRLRGLLHGYGPPTALLRGGHCAGAERGQCPGTGGTMALEPSPFPRSGLSAALASAEGETEAWRSALGSQGRPAGGAGQGCGRQTPGDSTLCEGHLWSEDMIASQRWTPHPVCAVASPAPSASAPGPSRYPRAPKPLLPWPLCLSALSAPSWAQASLQIVIFPCSSPPRVVQAQASFPLEAWTPDAGLGVQRFRALPPT